MRWPKYWSFSFNISPSNEHPGLISFRMDWLDLLAVQGTLKKKDKVQYKPYHLHKQLRHSELLLSFVESFVSLWRTVCQSSSQLPAKGQPCKQDFLRITVSGSNAGYSYTVELLISHTRHYLSILQSLDMLFSSLWICYSLCLKHSSSGSCSLISKTRLADLPIPENSALHSFKKYAPYPMLSATYTPVSKTGFCVQVAYIL